MFYEIPDRIWAEKEIKIMDEMGRDWFLKHPPKIWKIPKKSDDLVLESIKRKLRDELNWQFKIYGSFAHRYLRDLISDKHRVVIHHWSPSEAEKRIQKILGYKFYLYHRNNWREGIEKIIVEIKSNESQSMVR